MKDIAASKIMIRDSLSPNFDERPDGALIDTIVIHATVLASLAEVEAHFAKVESKVSAHFTIDRDGAVVRHVLEEKRAWHAGVSKMPDGRENVNHFSIGIELVNLNDGIDPYPAEQIQALKSLVKHLAARYSIRFLVPHHEIAMPPGRKDDPKGLDPALIKDILKS